MGGQRQVVAVTLSPSVWPIGLCSDLVLQLKVIYSAGWRAGQGLDILAWVG
jgi:hypothetical protein